MVIMICRFILKLIRQFLLVDYDDSNNRVSIFIYCSILYIRQFLLVYYMIVIIWCSKLYIWDIVLELKCLICYGIFIPS